MLVVAHRASAILFNIIKSFPRPGRFLLPANVCPIVPLTLLKARREFAFVDISATTLCMDLEAARDLIEQRPDEIAGLIFVRTYGAIHALDRSFETVRAVAPGALIIDDRCLCRPELPDWVETSADAVLFSTGHAKFADLGLGGYAVLSCRTPYSTSSLTYSARALADLTDDYKRAVELNRRFVYRDSDWLQVSGPRAAMDRYWQQVSDAVRLGDAQKEQLNAIYRASLPAQCQLPPEFQTWRFNIRVPAKLSLIRKIFTAGLFASSHYAPLTGVFADGDAPEATRLHQEILNLFNDRYFDAERAARIASIVTRHIADHSR